MTFGMGNNLELADGYESVDLYDFQKTDTFAAEFNNEYFCRMDWENLQNVFYCLLCAADLKSWATLLAHCSGRKHVKAVMNKKKRDFGVEEEPINAPKAKKKKRTQNVIPNPREFLQDKLPRAEGPVLGLEYVTEYLSSDRRDNPIYTCSLDGCKSAWGSSDDMFFHVGNPTHLKNFLSLQSDCDLKGANNAQTMQKAMEMESPTDVVIKSVRNDRKYDEILRTENGTKLKNANLEPLGAKRIDADLDETQKIRDLVKKKSIEVRIQKSIDKMRLDDPYGFVAESQNELNYFEKLIQESSRKKFIDKAFQFVVGLHLGLDPDYIRDKIEKVIIVKEYEMLDKCHINWSELDLNDDRKGSIWEYFEKKSKNMTIKNNKY